jgi:CBS domain-containing protein
MAHRSVRETISGRKPCIARGDTTIAAASRTMKKHDIGALMVVDGGRLVGIFTERDAVFRVLAEGKNPAKTALADVMTTRPKTIAPDRAIDEALLMMHDGGFRHVPVVDGGKPLGMISARDALDPELREVESEIMEREHFAEVLR